MSEIRFYSTSKKLIKNVKSFYDINFFSLFNSPKENDIFVGWGRKKSGLKAILLAKKYKTKFLLLEDGALRSLDLGLYNSPTFSIVKDDVGIYYDSTQESKFENILNSYNFDDEILEQAKKAINLIKKFKLSKYNNNKELPKELFNKKEKRILIITQAKNDLSLKYGQASNFNTIDMIKDAINENKEHKIYLKIHPDVLSGKKKSDFNPEDLPKELIILSENYNPIELLAHFDKVYTKTSTMGFEALLMGCECVCYGMPFYAGWQLTKDKISCERRRKKRTVEEIFAAFYLLYTTYFNPYKNKTSDIFDTIYTLFKYKNIEKLNSNRLFFLNFTLWKRSFIKPFFAARHNEIIFLSSLEQASIYDFNENDKLFVWGLKHTDELLEKFFGRKIQKLRVEDGFVRSIHLGSDLTRPYSLVVDSRGLFIDPSKQSDLEYILQNQDFDDKILKRAKQARRLLLKHKFSKYNIQKHKIIRNKCLENKKKILIPAQVEDDASMLFGAFGMTYLQLIKEVRKNNQDAYIYYKIHPDVLSGNRKGLKDEALILKYCDEILKDVSIHSVLDIVDEIHTITSTVGFEALLREKKVFTYGMPFYAGWQLTNDSLKCDRRTRKLSLDELVAGVLLLYPRYIDPINKNLCEFEKAFDIMLEIKERYINNKILASLMSFRNYTLRKIRRFYENLFGNKIV